MNTLISKVSLGSIILMIVAVFSSCSTYEDPNIVFKGPVDNDFLTALSRGEESIQLYENEAFIYYQAIDDNGKSQSKWLKRENLSSKQLGLIPEGFNFPVYKNLIISQGKVLHIEPYTDDTNPATKSPVYYCWDIYCNETENDIKFGYTSPFVYNTENQTLTICNYTFNIESIDKNHFILSSFADLYNHFHTACINMKCVTCFDGRPILEDISKVRLYDTQVEMQIGMLILMRKYFGDVLVFRNYKGWEGSDLVGELAAMEARMRKVIDDYHGVENYFDKRYPQE